jgi:hypothetical protein
VKKQIPSVTRLGVSVVPVRELSEICIDDISAVIRATDLRLRHLGWIGAPHTQNFEILKFLEQTQELKK